MQPNELPMHRFFKTASNDRSTDTSAVELNPAPAHGKLAVAILQTKQPKETHFSWTLEMHESQGAGSSSITMPKGGAPEDEEGDGAPESKRPKIPIRDDDDSEDEVEEEKEAISATEFEYKEEEQGAASNEIAQLVSESDTEGVGNATWMHNRWRGARGKLIVLDTDTEEQREQVSMLTGLLFTPLNHEAAFAVGQSLTLSPKWLQQKTRCTLPYKHVLEALKAGPAKRLAKLLERQDGGCAFFYKDTDYCIKHTDKSLTNERIMLRLTQTPTKTHYLMIEGGDHVVYNIQMQGSFIYGGRDDATILAKRPHAVPKPEADGNGLITILVTLMDQAQARMDQARDIIRTKLTAALEEVEMVKEPWVNFDTAGNRKGRYDHLTQSQRRQGGLATIESHGEQMGNCGRKS